MLSPSLSVWTNPSVLPDFHTSPTNTATLGTGTSLLLSSPLNHSGGCTPGVACDVTRGPGHLSPWGCAQKGSSVGAPWVLPPVAPALSSPSPPSAPIQPTGTRPRSSLGGNAARRLAAFPESCQNLPQIFSLKLFAQRRSALAFKEAAGDRQAA